MKKVILLSVKFVCFFIVSFLLTQTTLAQSVSSIMGKVLDSTGESVIGASVLVKGTTSGTITDIDGNFKLDNVPSNALYWLRNWTTGVEERIFTYYNNIQLFW